MPGSPPFTPRKRFPRYSNSDAADFAGSVNPIVDADDAYPPLVTALTPGVGGIPNPVTDGFEVIYLADATNGIRWHLIYRSGSASSYKWEFLGGSPLFAENTTQHDRTNTAYGDLTGPSVGPSVVAPLAGDYIIDFGAWIQNNNAGAVTAAAVQIGAATTVDDDAVAAAENGNAWVSPAKRMRRTVSAAATTLTMRYASSVGTGTFTRRYLSVIPARVG